MLNIVVLQYSVLIFLQKISIGYLLGEREWNLERKSKILSSYRLKELDPFSEVEKVMLKFESAFQVSRSLWDWRGGILVYYFKRPSQNYWYLSQSAGF